MERDSLVFNSCAFIASVFLLQKGVVTFTANTAILARRWGVPDTLVALLTVGAEWEELAIVVASIVQRRPSLALGSVVGSSISNVMGAFALGLLFSQDAIRFDLSAKIYSGALFAVSTVFTLLAFTGQLDLTGGIFFIVGFAVYVVSICSAIYDGILDPTPEPVPEEVEEVEEVPSTTPTTEHQELHVAIYPSVLQCHPTENSPLLPAYTSAPVLDVPPRPAGTRHHVFLIFIGLAALSVAAYTVSQSAASLASIFHISNTLIGITLVSISTTLPEKIIAIIDSRPSHTTLLTATTAGSNMFLLTLCIGVLLTSGSQDDTNTDAGRRLPPGTGLLTDSLVTFEVWTVWACSVLLMILTWTGATRWLGALLFGLYVSFVGIELTFLKR